MGRCTWGVILLLAVSVLAWLAAGELGGSPPPPDAAPGVQPLDAMAFLVIAFGLVLLVVAARLEPHRPD